jgi:hypothetical protein
MRQTAAATAADRHISASVPGRAGLKSEVGRENKWLGNMVGEIVGLENRDELLHEPGQAVDKVLRRLVDRVTMSGDSFPALSIKEPQSANTLAKLLSGTGAGYLLKPLRYASNTQVHACWVT